jgi:hypothetical protein
VDCAVDPIRIGKPRLLCISRPKGARGILKRAKANRFEDQCVLRRDWLRAINDPEIYFAILSRYRNHLRPVDFRFAEEPEHIKCTRTNYFQIELCSGEPSVLFLSARVVTNSTPTPRAVSSSGRPRVTGPKQATAREAIRSVESLIMNSNDLPRAAKKKPKVKICSTAPTRPQAEAIPMPVARTSVGYSSGV